MNKLTLEELFALYEKGELTDDNARYYGGFFSIVDFRDKLLEAGYSLPQSSKEEASKKAEEILKVITL